MTIHSGHHEGDFKGTIFEIRGSEFAPVVALIHGLGLTRDTWADYVEPLAADYRVVSYDLYGHGQSSFPPELPSLKTYSEQLQALTDYLDLGPVAVVGFSLGGMINRRFAMDHPASVSSLVILNSPHARNPEDQVAVEQSAKDSAAAGPSANLDEALRRWFTPAFLESRPDIVRQIARWVTANDAQAYADCRFVLANGVVELVRPDPPILHPTLVMTCERDTGSTPAMAKAIASEIVGAELAVVGGLQHLGLIERPDLFLPRIQQFLAAHAASGK